VGLIDAIFKLFAALCLIRLLVSERGQVGYNPVFQGVVRFTEPVLGPMRRRLGARFAAPALILGLILVQGVFYGGAGEPGRILELGPGRWIFNSIAGFWWLGRSLFSYLVFFYRMLFLVLLLDWLWRDSLSPAGRLLREVSAALGGRRFNPALRLGTLAAAFWLGLVCLRFFSVLAGWLPPGSGFLSAALGVALWIPFDFIGVFIVLIVARAVLSFFPPGSGEIRGVLDDLTEPLLRPLRGLNLRVERWDLTPAAAVFILLVIQRTARIFLGWLF